MKSLYDILESLLDDEDEILDKVGTKYSIPNIIKNLGNTRYNIVRYKEIGDLLFETLAPYRIKANILDKIKPSNIYIIKVGRIMWSDSTESRVGLAGSKPYNVGVLIVGNSEAKLRMSRPREQFAFANGFIFGTDGFEYNSFKETLATTKGAEVYELPEEFKQDIARIVTFNDWKYFDKI